MELSQHQINSHTLVKYIFLHHIFKQIKTLYFHSEDDTAFSSVLNMSNKNDSFVFFCLCNMLKIKPHNSNIRGLFGDVKTYMEWPLQEDNELQTLTHYFKHFHPHYSHTLHTRFTHSGYFEKCVTNF